MLFATNSAPGDPFRPRFLGAGWKGLLPDQLIDCDRKFTHALPSRVVDRIGNRRRDPNNAQLANGLSAESSGRLEEELVLGGMMRPAKLVRSSTSMLSNRIPSPKTVCPFLLFGFKSMPHVIRNS